MNLHISDQAFADLVNIAEYLSDNAGQQTAHRMINDVQKAFQLLASMPGIGVSRNYGGSGLKGMRMLSVPNFPNYLIFYRPSETEIEILRVFHGAQNIEQIFTDEKR